MPFIGNKPSAVPLTSADITDGIIVNADINANAAIESSKLSITSPLSITGNSTAGSEIRLPEDTDNGSNYVALKAADSIASNLTFTLPSADGSANQALITNGSGSLSFATVGAAAGQVIQVVSTIKQDTFSTAATTTYTDITGFSVTITPSAAANKILVLVSVSGSVVSNNRVAYRLMRDSTAIGNGTPVGNRQAAFAMAQANSTDSQFNNGTVFLDSPNTTSSTTYKVQLICESIAYIGTSQEDANINAAYGVRTASTITVMEIKG